MSVSEKITEIVRKLEEAVSYEDWQSVEKCISDLEFLCETLELSFPFDGFDDEY
jgi:hypothetical protein